MFLRASDARDQGGIVDAHGAGIDAPGNFDRLGHATGEHRGRQAKIGIVRESNRFVCLGERHYRHDRTEGFLTHQLHVVIDGGNDGRATPIAATVLLDLPAELDPGTAIPGIGELFPNDGGLAFEYQWTEVSRGDVG